jgi:hypothetical protein
MSPDAETRICSGVKVKSKLGVRIMDAQVWIAARPFAIGAFRGAHELSRQSLPIERRNYPVAEPHLALERAAFNFLSLPDGVGVIGCLDHSSKLILPTPSRQ